MNTTTKFQSYVLSITTLIVFTLWVRSGAITPVNPLIKILVTSLVSLGLYRLVAAGLLLIFKKWGLVRRLFLGPLYMEGTWVGFYIGIQGNVRFLVERFEQDLESLVVRGRAYNEHLQFHTSWISYPANIDLIKGELTYTFEVKGVSERSNGSGVVFFNLTRKNQNEAPTELSGFSADLHNDGRRTRSLEIKLANRCDVPEHEALEAAIGFYEKNKNKF